MPMQLVLLSGFQRATAGGKGGCMWIRLFGDMGLETDIETYIYKPGLHQGFVCIQAPFSQLHYPLQSLLAHK